MYQTTSVYLELERFLVRETRYDDRFQKFLNEGGSIDLGSFRVLPSIALKKVSPISYGKQYTRWYTSQLDSILFFASDHYPYEIAYFSYAVCYTYDNHSHRLHLLRSLWESIIHVLFDIILAECAHENIDLQTVRLSHGGRLKRSHCLTESCGKKIDIMRSILLCCGSSLELSRSIVRDDFVFDLLFSLNRVRNSMQHEYALDEEESRVLFEQKKEDVCAILFDLAELAQVRFAKFRRVEGENTRIYAEFQGFSGLGKDTVYED